MTSSDPERNSIVVNLSRVPLSETESNLLSRGLSFCPTPRHLSKIEIIDDLESYFRCLCLREFFIDQDGEEEGDAETPFRLPSNWMPPKDRDAALETYIRKVRTDVECELNILQAKRSRDNLPSEERSALKNLRQ